MKTRRIAALAALTASVFLAGCVEGGYYGEVGWGGPVIYGPGYADPYYGGYYPRYGGYYPRYGGYYPRYGGYHPRYDRYYHRRYDRRYERPRRPDYVARPDRPRPSRPDYSRPSGPAPIVAQPQSPRVRPDFPRGSSDCAGPGCSGLRGRGEGWGKMQ